MRRRIGNLRQSIASEARGLIESQRVGKYSKVLKPMKTYHSRHMSGLLIDPEEAGNTHGACPTGIK